MLTRLTTPLTDADVDQMKAGDQIEVDGVIYCGRDAVLPKLVSLIEANNLESIGVDLKGSAIFHTAFSPAGIGPTTTNKVEIEGSMPMLSRAGVRLHIGKGGINQRTIDELNKYRSVFAVTPPVTALFSDKIVSHRIAAFPEEGMEALYEVHVKGFPAIVAVAHGESILR
ncbi:MAG: fumarate hydratase C-terminal domain-containing protein [Acidobacteriaceae bacterium]